MKSMRSVRFDAVAFLEGLYRDGSADTRATETVLPTIDIDDLPGDWRVWFEERAAIMEYHGGLPREHAEAEALKETVQKMEKNDARYLTSSHGSD